MGSNNYGPLIKTLLYSDIFDYPLSGTEIWKYLISSKKIKKEEFIKDLKTKNPQIVFRNGFYYLKGRKEIINQRLKREKYSQVKLKEAKKIIKELTFIPTILFIGISGSLSLKNADKDDDIDLFIIAKKNTLWFTRLLLIIVLLSLGKYRNRKGVGIKNKACLNLLIDETNLSFPRKRHNLFTAHEIAQVIPMFEREKTYQKFLEANVWVNNFLPNVFESIDSGKINSSSLYSHFLVPQFMENIAKKLQYFYMKKHITSEEISDHFLAFHPFDYKKHVLNLLRNRPKLYRIQY